MSWRQQLKDAWAPVHNLWNGPSGASTVKPALFLAVILVAAVAAFLIAFPEPRGDIYVGGPQVYTRERLVNDRYDQERWLKDQLDKANGTSDLLTGRIWEQKKLGISAGDVGTGDAGALVSSSNGSAEDNAQNASQTPTTLPFSMQFLIRASLRDTIRELILENSLDDRHDLRGNSLYGLKFDTSVIPSSSYGAAEIGVSVSLGAMGHIREAVTKTGEAGLPIYIVGYYRSANQESFCSKQNDNDPRDLFLIPCQIRDIYKDWIADLTRRLNQYVERRAAKGVPPDEECLCADKSRCGKQQAKIDAEKLAYDAASSILGEHISLRLRTSGIQSSSSVKLAKLPNATTKSDLSTLYSSGDVWTVQTLPSWANLVAISANSVYQRGNCLTSVTFEVKELADVIYVRSKLAEQAGLLPQTKPTEQSQQQSAREVQPSVRQDRQKQPSQIQPQSLRQPQEHQASQSLDEQQLKALLDQQIKALLARQVYETALPLKSDPNLAVTPDMSATSPDVRSDPSAQYILPRIHRLLETQHYEPFSTKNDSPFFLYPRGLFNFITKAANQDQFAYALSPRSELAGFLVDSLSSAALSAGRGSVKTGIQAGQSRQEARAAPRSATFVKADPKTIRFGWIIATNERDEPAEKSNLALVSTPAWIGKLNLVICTGWRSTGLLPRLAESLSFRRRHVHLFPPINQLEEMVKGDRDPTSTNPSPMPADRHDGGSAPSEGAAKTTPASSNWKNCSSVEVPVPPDFEALDTIMVSDVGRLPPEIFRDLMDRRPLVACTPAEIVIPGERLWRSTVVTLGGQRAERIIVLPNMRGILAEFQEVRPPPMGQVSEPRKLRVWTTEGMDELDQDFTINSLVRSQKTAAGNGEAIAQAIDVDTDMTTLAAHTKCLMQDGAIFAKKNAPTASAEKNADRSSR